MRDAIVVEKAANNYSAYGPDLPGCVATGHHVEEAAREIREAIAFHVHGLRGWFARSITGKHRRIS